MKLIRYLKPYWWLALLTPLTMVGAYAGMSISNQLRTFIRTGWRYIIVAILVMTGTFLASALIGQIVLKLMGTI